MEPYPTPGLKRRARKDGSERLIWACSDAARAAGYEPATVNLTRHADDPMMLSAACLRLQADMLQYLSGRPRAAIRYDGTLRSLFDLYETHPESTYRQLAQSSARSYAVYLRLLRDMIGNRRIDRVTGLDVNAWHRVWCEPIKPGGEERIAVGRFVVSVLKAALSFGIVAGIADCERLKTVLTEIDFPVPARRTAAPTRAQAEAIIAAAHTINRASVALTTALQFEGTLRQWDIIGYWLPLSDRTPSAVLRGKYKWIGLSWNQIDDDMILTLTPRKTLATSKATVILDLKLMPLVMREIDRVPPERRKGPMVIAETTGAPWTPNAYGDAFRRCAKIAGLPDGMWSRDLRAGGVTEARRAGVATEDIAKVAGHSTATTTAKIYDRAELEASRRVSHGRNKRREE
jgi:integrase